MKKNIDNADAQEVLRRLHEEYPDADCELNYENPLQLLVATILSAQCTDARVNKVTESLFQKYFSAQDYLNVDAEELENDIHSTGFYRNKAKNIRGACRVIIDDFGGKVPSEMADLIILPGVARKTANVVLGNVFKKYAGVVVDTHVKRVAFRLGLTKETSPVKVERDLMAAIPQNEWKSIGDLLIWHGRRACIARKPKCSTCILADICPKRGVTVSQ